MKGNPVSRLFLVELVFNLFIFTLCALTCVGLMITAHAQSRQSEDLTHAVYLAQRTADAWKQGAAHQQLQENTAQYEVRITPQDTATPGLESCDIQIYLADKILYELQGVCRR